MSDAIINLISTGLAIGDCTVDWTKKISDNGAVSTSEHSLTERANGYYKYSNPNITEDTDFYIKETATPANFAIGIFSLADNDIALDSTVAKEATLVTVDGLVDTLLARLTAARAGYLDELAAANIPTDIATLNALINAIDTSTELAARFTEFMGAGWTTQTLVDIRAAITALSGLEGARTITVQMYETGGTTPIADDTIGIWNSDQSLLLGVLKTDSNGQITFGRDDGTYKLVSQKAQVVFTTPETIIVTKDETFIRYGTAQTYPSPANPDSCNVYCDLKDFGLDAKEGVTFTARLTTTPQAVDGIILNAEAWSRDTNAAGRAVLTLPQGVKFTISSNALGGDSKTIRIDTAALSSLVLANQIT